MEDLTSALYSWIPALIFLTPMFWFLVRIGKSLKKTRKEAAEFREHTSQFWEKTLTLQSESNQLLREMVAELHSRR